MEQKPTSLKGKYMLKADKLQNLTRSELLVLREVLTGKSNVEIGKKLHITPSSVKFHTRNLFKKSGIQTRSKLILHFADCIPMLRAMNLDPKKAVE